MRDKTFQEIIEIAKTCPIQEYKQILNYHKDNEKQRTALIVARRKQGTPELNRMITFSKNGQRTIYESAYMPPVKPGNLTYHLDRSIENSDMTLNELVETMFGVPLTNLNKGEFNDPLLFLKYYQGKDMIFSGFKQYEAYDQTRTDALVTKNGNLLMLYLHSVDMETAAEQYFVVGPERGIFEKTLEKITGFIFLKKKSKNIELSQRENIFGPLIKNNEISIESFDERSPEISKETSDNFLIDLIIRYSSRIIQHQINGEYSEAENVQEIFDQEFLTFEQTSEEEKLFDLDEARIELNLTLLKHYCATKDSKNKRVITSKIEDIERKLGTTHGNLSKRIDDILDHE